MGAARLARRAVHVRAKRGRRITEVTLAGSYRAAAAVRFRECRRAEGGTSIRSGGSGLCRAGRHRVERRTRAAAVGIPDLERAVRGVAIGFVVDARFVRSALGNNRVEPLESEILDLQHVIDVALDAGVLPDLLRIAIVVD